ncbi:exoribonuclease II [Allopseudospirillum japonicum]|uniref:exoribonuclease II n=1 Tax=Allopseudospirillum japonicum TaxID=64971 RepID=UPI001C4361CE|nr:exoribonuclease II [Allopseudospirillum japonicum]
MPLLWMLREFMLQNNALLQKLKQNLRDTTPSVEGLVKGTDKSFGFLEVDASTSYFIPPPQMRRVMHGDKVRAYVRTENGRDSVEPFELVAPALERFIARVQKREGKLAVVPDHHAIRTQVSCRIAAEAKCQQADLQEGDWVVARLLSHPLPEKKNFFFGEVVQKIASAEDPFAPWSVILARHQLPHQAPDLQDLPLPSLEELAVGRTDLIHLPFVTIDSASTLDMDDALYIEAKADGGWKLQVAIADPTAYIPYGTPLDQEAQQRCFSLYLPAREIPMLPEALSHDLCSLRAQQVRPALVCQLELNTQGAIEQHTFQLALVQSQAKLAYDQVSDWLENTGSWQPETPELAALLHTLNDFAQARLQWRTHNALVYPDRPDYRFVLDPQGQVTEIKAEYRRQANRLVEEAMIAANQCAASTLAAAQSTGVFNTHTGFAEEQLQQAKTLLVAHGLYDAQMPAETLNTLEGFLQVRRALAQHPQGVWLEQRLRKLQNYAEIRAQADTHLSMGLPAYATWTSPIRKYGDMLNHRLLKQSLGLAESDLVIDEALLAQLNERRRLNAMAERDVRDWLYARYLSQPEQLACKRPAEILDISRGGLRVRLQDIGATAFMPASLIHPNRDEIVANLEEGTLLVQGQVQYRLGDTLEVQLQEVREETRSIIARPFA